MIFIQGNSDQIIGEDSSNNGFRISIEYLMSQGYKKAQIYGSMWGFSDNDHARGHYHQPEYVLYIRRFINAVLQYTEAAEIDVISHSMGVNYARRAIKGGWANIYARHGVGAEGDKYYIGQPFSQSLIHLSQFLVLFMDCNVAVRMIWLTC